MFSVIEVGKTKGLEPRIGTVDQPIEAAGMRIRTGVKSIYRDLPRVYQEYLAYKEAHGIPNLKEPWEYVSLSCNFEADRAWDYCTGYVVTSSAGVAEPLEVFMIPAGTYAVFPVRPRFRFLLGPAMGRIKRYIYVDWLPRSGYEFTGYEFEYNGEKKTEKDPTLVELYVGIRERKKP